jgi:hypothetical protein
MNDIASMRNIRPFEPGGSAGTATADAAALFAAATGLAVLETVADFAVILVEGKRKF